MLITLVTPKNDNDLWQQYGCISYNKSDTKNICLHKFL